jgi:tetratricopeptide (TPR) repeat protein
MPAVLIQGATGTGKGLIARAMHGASGRAQGPFVDVNCAAIPETLLESEMFGVERGAFTDARQGKPGLFHLAHEGTIFLDEIGLLPEGLQAKLLKAIEERSVRRLGGTRSEPVDAWVIAATNEDLVAATRAGRFRADLYHRLAVVTFVLPPLSERGDDIRMLAEHFLARACSDYGIAPKTLTPAARAALRAYAWPGNIRELANLMERVALLAEDPQVTPEVLALPVAAGTVRAPAPPDPPRTLEAAVEDVEREHLLAALTETQWNVTRAAAQLGISRNTLRYRIEKHGLRPGMTSSPPRRASAPPAPEPMAPRPTPAPATPVGGRERRRLTLLRASVTTEPASFGRVPSFGVLDLLADKVLAFGGRMAELNPSGALAVFGLEPVEDAPARAAHAAMAILKGVERARVTDRASVGVRLGIHVDQFMVQEGQVPVLDRDARLHAWAFLESLVARAEAGDIAVSDAAAPFLERRFDVVPVEPAAGGPDRVYRLAGRERIGFELAGRMATFVGRQSDLDLLRSRFEAAARGSGQVVGIGGEAGIGKSRLLFEFRRGLARRDVPYVHGHCLSYGRSTPYLPIVDLVQAMCGIAALDSPEVVGAKVRAALQGAEMDAAEAAPYLLYLLGIKPGTEPIARLSPQAIKERFGETVRQLAVRMSRRQSLVVALEDLHWVDEASDELLASMVDAIPGTGILLVCTYRPGFRPRWIEKSYATQMALMPLLPEDSRAVLRSLSGPDELPERLVEAILSKAEGNPFFLEELARVARDQRADAAGPVVPDTVEEVLRARINALAEAPKRLLQAASVVGREVPIALLEAVAAESAGIEPALQELVRLELLHRESAGRDKTYVFKHALTHEVAYGSLDVGRRQLLHERAGRALETRYAGRLEEVYGRLAHHYGQTTREDKAVDYLVRSADRAARSHAHAEAAAAFHQAIVRVVRSADSPARDELVTDLIIREAHSLHFIGRFKDAVDLLCAHTERVSRLGHPARRALFHFWLGRSYSVLGDFERSAPNITWAIEFARDSGDAATLGKAYFMQAYINYWGGQPREGAEHGQRAADLLKGTDEPWWLGMGYWVLALNRTLLGEFETALAAARLLRDVGDAIADPRLQTYGGWITGWIHATRGDWEAGIEACRRSLEGSRDPVNTAYASGQLGHAHLEKGEPMEAIPLLVRAIEQFGAFRVPQTRARLMTLLSEARLVLGETAEAERLAAEALQIARRARFPYAIALAQRALGRAALVRGDFVEAGTQLTAAQEAFDAMGARFEAGRTWLARAEAAASQGDASAARHQFREALRLFEALDVPRHGARARELAARCRIDL